MNRKIIGILVSILFFGAGIVSAVNINVESTKMIKDIENPNPDIKTFNPTDDVSIKEATPNANYGSSYLVVRNRYGGFGQPGYEDDILIKFDISELSSGVTIISATLNLFYYKWSENFPVGRPLTLYRITSDWDEAIVTWNTRPSYNTAVTSMATVPSSPNVWVEWDVTSDVEIFVKGQEINYGWQIMDETYWGMFDIPATWFHQKEYSGNGDEYIPYLEIEFTTSRNKDITNQFFLQFLERFPLLNRFLTLLID